jgi:hypothetical protein
MMTATSSLELSRILELTEGAAHADMFRVAPPEYGFEVEETDEYVARFAPSMDVMMFNRVVGLGLNSPASKSTIERLVQRYRDKGVKNFAIQLSPDAQPPELYQWMSELGLGVRDYWTKGYRPADLNLTVDTDLRVEQIDKSQANIFGEVACAGFEIPLSLLPLIASPVGLPGWKHYIAWDGDRPAAVAALMVKGDIGWLGLGATAPEFRRRGAQGALIARRIRDGSKLGCKMFVAETGKDVPEKRNPSFHNMIRTGFVVAYDRPNYMQPKE